MAGPVAVWMRTERSDTWLAFLITRPVFALMSTSVSVTSSSRASSSPSNVPACSALAVMPAMWMLRKRGVRSDTGSGGTSV